jgi:hypothetical protein
VVQNGAKGNLDDHEDVIDEAGSTRRRFSALHGLSSWK